ncbi:MAG: serine--tRNA ligase [Bacilli bacterium]|nr:serine--tRNA ligase [Bacilli bacterium]
MIDIRRIVEDKANIEKALLKRMDSVNLDEVIKLDQERREVLVKVETLKAEKNKLSKEIGQLKREGKDSSSIIKMIDDFNVEIENLDIKENELTIKIKDILIILPNILDDDVIEGDKENNEVVRTYKEKPVFNFKTKDHFELTESLNLVDHTRGTKLSGHGFWIYKGIGARLEWALINYFIDFHTKNNYEFIMPPYILGEECGYTAGQFPKFRDDIFEVGNNKFLLPTAETALVNYHRDEILNINELPKKYFSYTACFRREAGSHRTDERGTIRGHQFNKVEMFAFSTNEESDEILVELIDNAEQIVKSLGLHYRVTKLAAKDVSASMAKTYDIEVWIPSMNKYVEVSSVSNARDYQARRGMIRYRNADGKIEYVHTLNGSGLATSRLFPAILEQFQNEDGTVTIPEVLRPYLGNIKTIG